MPATQTASVPAAQIAVLHHQILEWYHSHARDLPWRDPSCSPWGVFISEVMLQQTPVQRVLPVWREWMQRWPTPTHLAEDSPGEAVRAWGRLGYPRRALRLHAAATTMVERHGGEVPSTDDELRTLPGVGAYTAAAVAAFAHGHRTTVVDTNVRRVLARVLTGVEYPAPALTRAEERLAGECVPSEVGLSVRWNVAVMELGALVCTARSPQCESCPVRDQCRWAERGYPRHEGPPRRGQRWEGTDRQARGRILASLRSAPGAVTRAELLATAAEVTQAERCLASLVEDGLVEPLPHDTFGLPR